MRYFDYPALLDLITHRHGSDYTLADLPQVVLAGTYFDTHQRAYMASAAGPTRPGDAHG